MTYQIVNNARRMFEYSPLLVFLVVILMFCALRFIFYRMYSFSNDSFCTNDEECAVYSMGDCNDEVTGGNCVWNGTNCVYKKN